MKPILVISLFVSVIFSSSLCAQKYVSSDDVLVETEWNGVTFSSEKSLFENLALAPGFAETGLLLEDYEQDIFKEGTMFTVFVSVDSSYRALPEETYKALFSEGNALEQFFKFYIIPGRLDSYSLKKAIANNSGKAYLRTLNGENLGIKEVNGQLVLVDSQNNTATVTASNFYHSNGFFHIVEGLVFPSK
ncbi:putative surface protein with fasciclin (FAS1) repeats [Ulvibacter sp. MAR_2010_11]|uniref:fasciclin domain-containing protein n=1 Tax=Ulvibacter sp. MAR_2010_11 TaxID=1250229 RepID=UPI000C2CB235|nr:fasciclin domain-containing protein [Ulvibacter sp. MAR_2010_11]PKA84581.1 putative surface protein with fasciclin (FAS1) repeats [Ulvibacter sp. MAR_2010_11]